MATARMKASVLMFAAMAVMAPVWGQSPEEIQKITNAMPDKAAAKPEKARKVLVFSQTLKYHHTSIPYGEKAFQIMGDKTGAFNADVTTDPAHLSAENLAQYDAVIFNNPTGETVATEPLREALLNFVRSGKGFVGIHAATDTNFEWAEYGEMVGGYFDNHPWRASDTVTLKIERPKHPLNRAFDGKTFEVKDEIYQMKDPYSRDKVLVLVSLDTEKTDMNKEGIHRTDNDFAISWVRNYGEGRVFYCSLGHNHHIFWNETVLKHYLDGIQFAMGDLKAPADPKGAAKDNDNTDPAAATPVAEVDVDPALAALDTYDYGKDRAFLLVIDEAIRQTAKKEKQRNRLANALTDKAVNNGLSFAARELAMRRLSEIGLGRNIDKLEKLLSGDDERIAEVARQTIASIPGERADKALIKALESSKGKVREGVILSLGERRVKEAIQPLGNIARIGDEAAAGAAMQALGNIGNGEAAKVLLDDVRPPESLHEVRLMAINDAATELSGQNKKLAARLFDRVMEMGENSPARLAAFKGKALLEANPEDMALKALDENEPGVIQIARELLVRGNDPSITAQLLQRRESSDGDKKVMVVEILGARGDKSALQAVTALAGQPSEGNEALQVAALSALETLGDQNSVPLLIKVAAEAKGQVQDAAEQTLKDIAVPEVNPELLRLVNEAASPDEKVVAIETVTVRKAEDAIEPLLTAARGGDDKVAIAALKAIAELGTYKELGPVLEIQAAATSERILREGARTTLAMAKHYKNPEDAVKLVQSTFASSQSPEVKASLLTVLSSLGSETGLATIRENLQSGDEKMKDAAVRALADFPTNSAIDDLLKIASESDNEVHRVLALRAVARLISQPSAKTSAEKLDIARRALELATGIEEKKTVIGALADLKEPGVLPLILPFLDQEELKQESAVAILKQAPVANAFEPAGTAELLSPLKDKVTIEQWNKLEEVLTPGTADGGAIRAYQATALFKGDGGTSLGAVMDNAFGPESGEAEFPNMIWAGTDDGDNKGQADLAATYPDAKNSAVYLRAHVWSPEDRKARLDTGSDDGMRAWVNGEQVFESAAKRGFSWWGDKTPVSLKRGWNTILLKIVQGSGGYTAAARVVDESGAPFTDLKYSALPQGE